MTFSNKLDMAFTLLEQQQRWLAEIINACAGEVHSDTLVKAILDGGEGPAVVVRVPGSAAKLYGLLETVTGTGQPILSLWAGSLYKIEDVQYEDCIALPFAFDITDTEHWAYLTKPSHSSEEVDYILAQFVGGTDHECPTPPCAANMPSDIISKLAAAHRDLGRQDAFQIRGFILSIMPGIKARGSGFTTEVLINARTRMKRVLTPAQLRSLGIQADD